MSRKSFDCSVEFKFEMCFHSSAFVRAISRGGSPTPTVPMFTKVTHVLWNIIGNRTWFEHWRSILYLHWPADNVCESIEFALLDLNWLQPAWIGLSLPQGQMWTEIVGLSGSLWLTSMYDIIATSEQEFAKLLKILLVIHWDTPVTAILSSC